MYIAGAVAAVPGEPGSAPKSAAAAAPASAPAAKPKAVTLTAPANTPLTVRVATEVNSGTAQAGQRFQGNLDTDLVGDLLDNFPLLDNNYDCIHY